MSETVTAEAGLPLVIDEVIVSQTLATQHAEDIGGAKTRVTSLVAVNLNAAIRWLLLSKTADARTDVNALSLPVAAATIATFGTDFFGAAGWKFGAHFSYAWSTGGAGSYVAATAADHSTIVMGG